MRAIYRGLFCAARRRSTRRSGFDPPSAGAVGARYPSGSFRRLRRRPHGRLRRGRKPGAGRRTGPAGGRPNGRRGRRMSLRETLLERCRNREHRTFEVPGLGEVTIRALSSKEQIELAESIPEQSSDVVYVAHYIAASLVHRDSGALVLSPTDIDTLIGDDGETIGLDAKTAALIFREIKDLNGLDVGRKDAEKN